MGNFAVFHSKKTTKPAWSMGNKKGIHPLGNGYMPGYTTPVNWVHPPPPDGWKPKPIVINPPVSKFQEALQNIINGFIASDPQPTEPVQVYNPSKLPQTASVSGPGPYEQEFSLTPEQAGQLYVQDASLGELIFNMLVEGTDPWGSPSLVQPYGSPGTTKFEILGPGPSYETQIIDAKRKLGLFSSPGIFPGDYNAGGINPRLLNVKPPKKKKPKKGSWLDPTGLGW